MNNDRNIIILEMETGDIDDYDVINEYSLREYDSILDLFLIIKNM